MAKTNDPISTCPQVAESQKVSWDGGESQSVEGVQVMKPCI